MSKYINNLDLNGLQLLNAVIQNLAIEPSNPKEGSIYYDTVAKKLKWYDGSKWINADASDAKLSAEDIVNTINDSSSMIDYQRIDGLSQMLQDVSMSGGQIIDAINQELTKLIKMNRVEGLESALQEKENIGVAANKSQDALEQAKQYTDKKTTEAINNIRDGAGEAYDTLAEIQAFIEGHQDDIQELLNASHKHSESIGDGVATEHTVAHNLNSRDVVVELREEVSPYAKLEANIEFLDENNIIVRTAEPIQSDEKVRVTVVG